MPLLTVPGVDLPSGETIPILGQGTWHLGQGRHPRAEEIRALREGVDLGMTLIDTAEMYGDGRAEQLVGEAIAGRRDDIFLVSKVLPSHATEEGTIAACRKSLRRIGTDRLDLYLLHWRGPVPLQETIAGFERLHAAGLIRHWGVSNFDVDDMEAIFAAGGTSCATNQVLYNVARRGPEFDLLPWMRKHDMPAVAYSPIDHGRLPKHSVLDEIGRARGLTPVSIALAWVLAQPGVCAIPKAGSVEHVRENQRALDITLTDAELSAIDSYFKPPRTKRPLEML
jgi:diketogulonate reductase-like aldo/keto reductase